MMPTFAVVGHPNKGKSSIVATLAENEQISIGPAPGTTRAAAPFTFTLDGEPLYTLVDTPGFQRAKAVLDWLEAHAADASDRPGVVRAFVEAHRSDPRFHDECELLAPILDGAGVLYVVDGAKPYGAEFEVEMEILRWTGRPRMALINLIGAGDYSGEWQRALGQFFSIVRVFDAMHADFPTRIGLLRAFAELDEGWRPELERAVAALEAERRQRAQRSAAEIASMVVDCLTFAEQALVPREQDLGKVRERLSETLLARLRQREQTARATVQGFYRHATLAREEQSLAVLDVDLFTEEGWELFGLSKMQLVISGSMAGAVAGLGIDALVGGSSFLLGTGIGAALGGLGTWLGGGELAKTRVLGAALGGKTLHVGPVSAANFPWVLLGRAWVHHHLVKERNHALRDAISAQLGDQLNLMDRLPDTLRKELARSLRELQRAGRGAAVERQLRALVAEMLGSDPWKPE